MTISPPRTVATDANVLINLIHTARLDLCAALPGYAFVVPDHVHEEIRDVEQRATLDEAVARGVLRVESIHDIEGVALFAELTAYLGRGEAACLALAARRGWSVASDEKKRFRREAERLVGKDRLLGTVEILVLAIRADLVTVADADADKAALELRRFKMPFASFRDLVR